MAKFENKTECKVSVFKELRNLPDQDVLEILDRCLDDDITPQGINKAAKQKKALYDVRSAICDTVGENWDVTLEL